MWVGLGGFVESDILYQTGTSSNCDNGVPTYQAWWEIVPDASEPYEQVYDVTVEPGDSIYAGVSFLNSTTLKLSIADYRGNTEEWAKDQEPPDSVNSKSVECIVERVTGYPSGNLVPVANFGKATFNNCEAQEANYGTKYVYPGADFPGSSEGLFKVLDSKGNTLISVKQSKTSPYAITATREAAT
jgi:hypothetical protein